MIKNEDLNRLRIFKRKAESANEKYLQDLKQITQRISEGESSEDPIVDICLVFYGSFDDEICKPYKDLKKRAEENQGKLILIATEKKSEQNSFMEIHHHSGVNLGLAPDPVYTKVDLELRMGYLNGIGFRQREGHFGPAIVFPMGRHVLGKNDYLEEFSGHSSRLENLELKLFLDNIVKEVHKLPSLYPESMKKEIFRHYPQREFTQILIGDEVDKYFTVNGEIANSYCKALDMLDSE